MFVSFVFVFVFRCVDGWVEQIRKSWVATGLTWALSGGCKSQAPHWRTIPRGPDRMHGNASGVRPGRSARIVRAARLYPSTMRAKLVGLHFKPCMTDVYLQIRARMFGCICTHLYIIVSSSLLRVK